MGKGGHGREGEDEKATQEDRFGAFMERLEKLSKTAEAVEELTTIITEDLIPSIDDLREEEIQVRQMLQELLRHVGGVWGSSFTLDIGSLLAKKKGGG